MATVARAPEGKTKMQSGKKNTYVLSEIVGTPYDELLDIPDRVKDTFRRSIGKHWIAWVGAESEYGDDQKYERFLADNHLNISYGKTVTRLLRNPPFISKQQKIYFVGDEAFWGADGDVHGTTQDWYDMLTEMTPDKGLLKDYSFRIDTPFDQGERKKIGDISGLGFVDVDFKYNYNNEIYEQSIISIREELLPNLYAFISDDISRNMYHLKTLQGRIEGQKARIRRDSWREANIINPLLGTEWIYFNLLSKAYKEAKARLMRGFYIRFQNLIVPFENLSLVSDTTLKESFPMFVEVKFSTDSVTEIAQILEDADLSTSLQRHVAAGCGSMDTSLLNLLGGGVENYYVSKENLSYFPSRHGSMEAHVGRYKYLDLMTWWKRYASGSVPSVYANQTFVGPDTRSVYISSGVQKNNLSQALSLLVFSGKLQNIIKDKTRSIEQIIEGGECHTETIIYRIAKYKGSSENNQPIQNYWFPNSNNIDVIDLVDTQVKYNSRYTYKIYAYQLVIGSEYMYGTWDMSCGAERTPLETCPDIEYPPLSGDVLSAAADASMVADMFTTLGTDTTIMNNVATDLVAIYVFSGTLPSLKDFNYFEIIMTTIASKYGFESASFSRLVLRAINNYAIGEIDEITVPSIQVPTEESQYTACVQTMSYPCVRLVEVPFFTHTGVMVDSPPLPPDVSIVPYRGENNKILLMLNSTVGEQELYPIPIYKSDRKHIWDLRRNKFLSPTDKITYRSDDNADSFEVLRLSEKPERYSDFANNQRASLTTLIEPESSKRASAVSMVDTVLPNQKYYYTFRTSDVHGKKSNPTKVFEIELVDNDGAVYMITNIIALEEIFEPYDPVKELGRYVQVVPRITQGLFNKAKSGLQDAGSALDTRSYALGVEEESIWGKKFKIRFISKSTGRKIDLNVTYKRRHEVTAEEEELRKAPSPPQDPPQDPLEEQGGDILRLL